MMVDEEEKTEIEDHIVWSIASYLSELAVVNNALLAISQLQVIGKGSKYILLVMNRGVGVMSPDTMDLLPMFQQGEK